jgi:long-chain acyl-CoA synthetase
MSKSNYEDVLVQPERWLSDQQLGWLGPQGAFARTTHALLYLVNWLAVRLLFRFSVEGRHHLPASGPFILAPNHASPLDPQFLGAGLPLALLQHAYWAGKESTVLKTWLRRTLSWCARIVPIANDATALAPAVTILQRGDTLIWFPEGARSLDGELHEFKAGVAWLLTKCDVPLIPVFIQGAHEACPVSWTMPRLRTRVVVRIGSPETAEQLGLKNATAEDIDRAIDSLRQSVMRLRDQSSSE